MLLISITWRLACRPPGRSPRFLALVAALIQCAFSSGLFLNASTGPADTLLLKLLTLVNSCTLLFPIFVSSARAVPNSSSGLRSGKAAPSRWSPVLLPQASPPRWVPAVCCLRQVMSLFRRCPRQLPWSLHMLALKRLWH